MTEQEAALAVEAWVNEVLPELAASYPHIVAGKNELPDAVVDVTMKRLVPEDPEFFPFAALEQTWLRVFPVEVSFLVESGDPSDEEASRLEQEQLRDFGRRLEAAFWADATLGDRVPMASPRLEFDYSAPFIEADDGTRGRQMILTMAVGEPVTELSD